jgi:hypothetical protein
MDTEELRSFPSTISSKGRIGGIHMNRELWNTMSENEQRFQLHLMLEYLIGRQAQIRITNLEAENKMLTETNAKITEKLSAVSAAMEG